MERLTELYNELSDMGVLLFSGDYRFEGGYDAAVIEQAGALGVFLDIERIRTVAQEKAAVAHEWAHIRTGTLHRDGATPELIRWGETKATRKQIKRLLPFEEMKAAVLDGFTEPCQLAELFCVPEDLVVEALEYYLGPCGLEF